MAATSVTRQCRSIYYVFGLASLSLLSPEVGAARLNVPKVLLPYFSTVVANYTLEVTETLGPDTCYVW